jgi:hypothetical protein
MDWDMDITKFAIFSNSDDRLIGLLHLLYLTIKFRTTKISDPIDNAIKPIKKKLSVLL